MKSNEVMNAVGFSEIGKDEMVMVNGGGPGLSFEQTIDDGGGSAEWEYPKPYPGLLKPWTPPNP
ncbi:MAG: hypothetical protein FWE09_07875 [Treponema sp.]|nr:hypothetical protein [Treponema sp.]